MREGELSAVYVRGANVRWEMFYTRPYSGQDVLPRRYHYAIETSRLHAAGVWARIRRVTLWRQGTERCTLAHQSLMTVMSYSAHKYKAYKALGPYSQLPINAKLLIVGAPFHRL